MLMAHVHTPDVGLTHGVHGSSGGSGMQGWQSLGRHRFGASPVGLGRRRLCPPAGCAPLRPGVLHLPPCRAQSQPFAHSWTGLEQDSALSFHPIISLLGNLRDPPRTHRPIPCHEPAPRMGGDGESPGGRHGGCGVCEKPLQPLTPGKGGWEGSPPCPHAIHLCCSASSLRSKCHPGPAAASTSALRLPSRRSQRGRKKPSKNLPASAKRRLPFAPAEVY